MALFEESLRNAEMHGSKASTRPGFQDVGWIILNQKVPDGLATVHQKT
ncbi:hypothetical protein [Desulfosoma sp.]